MKNQDTSMSIESMNSVNMNVIPINKFQSEDLNILASQLLDLNQKYKYFMKSAEKNLYSAFRTRWLAGKYICDSYDKIIDECGSQKYFAERIGETEATISNNKRGYEYLQEEGCDTWEDVKDLLGNKDIKPTVRNFEKIGTLLNEPQKETKQIDQAEKDRNRIETLRGELEEILRRNEPANNPDIVADTTEFLEDLDEIKRYLETFDPSKSRFKSEKYIEFIRSFGRDLITMEPCERCHPHHTTASGGSGGMGETLPDYYAIPVSMGTHTLIHRGIVKPAPEEILQAQFIVMSAFVQKVLKPNKG